jgi:hypothetical protein
MFAVIFPGAISQSPHHRAKPSFQAGLTRKFFSQNRLTAITIFG